MLLPVHCVPVLLKWFPVRAFRLLNEHCEMETALAGPVSEVRKRLKQNVTTLDHDWAVGVRPGPLTHPALSAIRKSAPRKALSP